MKKIFLTILMFLLSINLSAYATNSDNNVESENIVLLTKKGFFENSSGKSINISPMEEIRRTFEKHYKYSNEHNLDGLSSLYSDRYCNEDGFNKKIYFDLIKKTWASYPEIKYRLDIRNVVINGDMAVVQVHESAYAQTPAREEAANQKGSLESISDTVYYLERVAGQWLVISDKISYEKTFLKYGSAKFADINLIAPSQVEANKSYTVSLQINPNTEAFVIGSIGQELITYPQVSAGEVFRKMPKDGDLERMFTSNSKNLNEYAVASYGITKAEVKGGKELKIYVTGLGFVMQRVNVVPKNNYIKEINEKTGEKTK